MSTKRILIIENVKQIIDCFVNQRSNLSLAELDSLLDLPKSTIHRIIVSLTDQGILSYNSNTGKYSFGVTLLKWSASVLNELQIHDTARPYLQSLRDLSNETATLTLRIGDKRIYVDQIQSNNEVRMSVEVGKPLNLYPGANGKAILSWLSSEEINFLLMDYIKQQNKNNSLEVANIKEQLNNIRINGYSISLGERVKGSVSISSPIFSHANTVMGAIGLSGPAGRFTKEKAQDMSEVLKKYAKEISGKTIWVNAGNI